MTDNQQSSYFIADVHFENGVTQFSRENFHTIFATTLIYIYPASFAKMPGLLANQQVEKIPLLRKRRKSI